MARKKNMVQREIIIETAYRLFYEKGYEGVTVKEIAEDCGISSSLLQHYFNKKEDLTIEIFYNLIQRIYAFIDDALPEVEKTSTRIAIFYRLFYEVLTVDNSKLLKIYYVVLSNAELLSRSTDYAVAQPTSLSTGKTLVENIGLYLLNGLFSQLFTLHLKNQLHLDTRAIVNIALYAYFNFLQFSAEEIGDTIKFIDDFLTIEKIDSFINLYKEDVINAE